TANRRQTAVRFLVLHRRDGGGCHRNEVPPRASAGRHRSPFALVGVFGLVRRGAPPLPSPHALCRLRPLPRTPGSGGTVPRRGFVMLPITNASLFTALTQFAKRRP